MKREQPKVRGIYEKVPGSGEWWICYFDAKGKRRREKAGTRSSALILYRKRKTEALEGRKLPENLRSIVKVSDIAPAIIRDYEINGKKSQDSVERRLRKHLLPFFGDMAVDDLTTEDFNRYMDRRKKAGAQNATINRELAALKRMFHLARYASPPQVRQLPVFPARLKENPPRQGFVEEQQFTKLIEHAEEPWFKALVTTAYAFGFRKSELLLQLRVSQIDLEKRTIRLDPGTTKNDQGRIVEMTNEVFAAVKTCVQHKQPTDYVFARADGKEVKDFRDAWWSACKQAGLGRFVKIRDVKGRIREKWQGLVPHDLRRSAARNMRRYGVDEGVIMKIGGWKTRSVFERYNIVSESDIMEAARKIEAGRNQAAIRQEQSATTSATSSNSEFSQYTTATN